MFDLDPFGSVEETSPAPEITKEEVETQPLSTTEQKRIEAAERKREADEKRRKANEEKEALNQKKEADKVAKSRIAIAGRMVDTEELLRDKPLSQWPTATADDHYIPDEVDYYDLLTLNRQINQARSISFRTKNRLSQAREAETEAGEKYRRAYNKALVSISGGTDATRKAVAEITCEDLYSDFLVAQTVVKNLTSLSYAASKDLDTLKTLSDNMRKQMSIQ